MGGYMTPRSNAGASCLSNVDLNESAEKGQKKKLVRQTILSRGGAWLYALASGFVESVRCLVSLGGASLSTPPAADHVEAVVDHGRRAARPRPQLPPAERGCLTAGAVAER